MKKKVFCVCMAVVIVIAMTGTSFASIALDYNLVYLERGGSEKLNVSFPGESDVEFYSQTGLSADWGNVNSIEKTASLTISAVPNATLGNKVLMVRGMSTSDFLFVNVYIIDKTAPVIYDVEKEKNGITISWDPTDVGRYQLQYKVKNGKWKTATEFTKATEYTVKNLVRGKKYYFRVRSVNYNMEWKEIYGKWSRTRTMTY